MMGLRRQEKKRGSVMHKSQLQEYAQKAGILPPIYDFDREGASHEPRFKCIVTLNGVKYESPPGFPNLKSAEHAAAKVALDALLSRSDGMGPSPCPVHESGLCKNLLQEYAQKNSLPLPVYQSIRSGEDHQPTFTSSVEIAGVKYSGGSAKSKKEAEIKAAKTALLAIQSALSDVPERLPVGFSSYVDPQDIGNNNFNRNTAGRKRGRALQAQAFGEQNAARKVKVEDTLNSPTSTLYAEPYTAPMIQPSAYGSVVPSTVPPPGISLFQSVPPGLSAGILGSAPPGGPSYAPASLYAVQPPPSTLNTDQPTLINTGHLMGTPSAVTDGRFGGTTPVSVDGHPVETTPVTKETRSVSNVGPEADTTVTPTDSSAGPLAETTITTTVELEGSTGVSQELKPVGAGDDPEKCVTKAEPEKNQGKDVASEEPTISLDSCDKHREESATNPALITRIADVLGTISAPIHL